MNEVCMALPSPVAVCWWCEVNRRVGGTIRLPKCQGKQGKKLACYKLIDGKNTILKNQHI